MSSFARHLLLRAWKAPRTEVPKTPRNVGVGLRSDFSAAFGRVSR